MTRRASALALAALALAGGASVARAHAGDDPGFVRVVNGAFVDEACNEFLFSGYNTFEIVEAGAGVCCGGKATVDRQFDMAAAQNLTVVRMFAFPVLEGFNLQTGPGKYNEKAAKGLDYVIAAAGRRGLKLVIALANNWKYNAKNTDAKCAYTNWTKSAKGCDDFWTDKNAIKLYKKNSERITGRVNTITGIKYRDDPTILAWNLINEPRCETPGCAPKMQSWIEDVSAHLKSVDPNHLITVGEDGFYQADNCWSDLANPVPRNGYKNQGAPMSGWPLGTGQDFVPNHAPSSIDFLSIHMWPDNWDRTDMDFGKAWIASHLDNTKLLGKPLVLEEFGKAAGGQWPDQTPAMRDDYYRLVYALAEQSISKSGGLKGIMFWRWAAVDTGADLGEFDAASMITTESSTFQSVIRPFSARTAETNLYRKMKVAGCAVDARTTPHVHIGDVSVPMTEAKAKKGGAKLATGAAPGNARPEVSALSIDTTPFDGENGFPSDVEIEVATIGNRRLMAAWATGADGGGAPVDAVTVPLAIQRDPRRPVDAKAASRTGGPAAPPAAPVTTPAPTTAPVGRALAAPQHKDHEHEPTAAPAPKKVKGRPAVGEIPAVKPQVQIASGAPIDAAALNRATVCPAGMPISGMQAAEDVPVAAPEGSTAATGAP